MKAKRLLLSAFIMASLVASAITDQEVIDYIKQQAGSGKTERQIGKELLAKGVTPEQAERIKAQYEAGQNAAEPMTETVVIDDDRTHNVVGATAPGASRRVAPVQNAATKGREIYGHKVFNSQSLTFEPSDNLATPQNYRLGPGDEVMIDIWGNSEDHLREVISPEGSIMIKQLGPVYLNGMTISEASKHLKSTFARKYAGVSDQETDIQLTLGQVRSISVDILGEVATPGTYRMSPFSTVFHALYNAGGINDIGSLRNIQVLRNNKKIAGVDIYEYLFNGKTKGNIRLEEGDVIIVPPYEQLVNVNGNVKRPMFYEIKPGETVKNILDFAGGFSGDAYSGMVRLNRPSETENELYNIERGEFDSYKLKDGDVLTVGTILDRYSNRVQLRGAVYRPGMFALGQDLQTISDLIRKADGLMENAYTDRVLLYREGPDLQLQVMSVDLNNILNGTSDDIILKRNDILEIQSIQDLERRGAFNISGMVNDPGTYPFADYTTVEDLIMMAGGLAEGASTARVDIARRIVDPDATEATQQLSHIFTVSIENGLAAGSSKGFLLKPFDQVIVRKSPGYSAQESVSIGGEVLFEGSYVLQRRNERLSDIVRRAGGIIDGAYIRGAHLERQLSESEIAARRETLRIAQSNSKEGTGDSIALSKIQVSNTYNVGIDMEKALANPGSTYDIVMKAGDRLFIPEEQSVVKISGDVMFPNAVVYVPGKNYKYYIEQAGGYGSNAKKGKAFVVYLNGTVAKVKGSTPIEPGCQIIVPSKSKNKTDWTKVLSFATSFSSVAAMAATITNMFK